jgi:hypothetical protein
MQEHNISPQILKTPLKTLFDPDDGQSMTYQNGLIHGRFNKRYARENTSPIRPYGIEVQDRAKAKVEADRTFEYGLQYHKMTILLETVIKMLVKQR